MTVNKTLERKFHSCLKNEGCSFDDENMNLEKMIEDILDKATLEFEDANIDFDSFEEDKKQPEMISKGIQPFTNHTDAYKDEHFTETITHSKGSETCQNKSRGWTIGGGVNLGYEGTGALATLSYSRAKSTANIESDFKQNEKTYEDKVHVPPHSKVKVAVMKQVTEFRCNVSDLEVTFKKEASNKAVKVKKGDKQHEKKFKLSDICSTVDSREKKLTLNGEFVWSELSTYVHKYDPEPL